MSFARIEGLETRRLFAVVEFANGVLSLNGKDGVEDDFDLRLTQDRSSVIVSYERKAKRTIDLDDIKSIKVTTKNENDEVIIGSALGVPITIDMGDGRDNVEIRGKNRVTIDLGSGDDWVNKALIDADANPGPAKLRVNGGTGNDEIKGRGVLHGDEGNDRLYGSRFKDFLYGDAGADYCDGEEGGDVIFGGDDNDRLEGDEGNDSVFGDAGDDEIRGGAGDDSLFGNAGRDTLYGDDPIDNVIGDDTLYGGKGEDQLHTNGETDVEKELEKGGEYKQLEELVAKFTRQAKKYI